MAPRGAAGEKSKIVNKDIELTQDAFNALHRRHRKRLRALQSQYRVSFVLGRDSRVLRVAGPPSAIAAVEEELANLSSLTVPVSPEVWAELMRMRKLTGHSFGAIAWLQKECNCRVHIERHKHEVRLYGNYEDAKLGVALLNDLDTRVCSKYVRVLELEDKEPVLWDISQDFNVTVRIDDAEAGLLAVIGIKAHVKKAVEALKRELGAVPAQVASRSIAPVQLPLSKQWEKDFASIEDLLCKLPGPLDSTTQKVLGGITMEDIIAEIENMQWIAKSQQHPEAVKSTVLSEPLTFNAYQETVDFASPAKMVDGGVVFSL